MALEPCLWISGETLSNLSNEVIGTSSILFELLFYIWFDFSCLLCCFVFKGKRKSKEFFFCFFTWGIQGGNQHVQDSKSRNELMKVLLLNSFHFPGFYSTQQQRQKGQKCGWLLLLWIGWLVEKWRPYFLDCFGFFHGFGNNFCSFISNRILLNTLIWGVSLWKLAWWNKMKKMNEIKPEFDKIENDLSK